MSRRPEAAREAEPETRRTRREARATYGVKHGARGGGKARTRRGTRSPSAAFSVRSEFQRLDPRFSRWNPCFTRCASCPSVSGPGTSLFASAACGVHPQGGSWSKARTPGGRVTQAWRRLSYTDVRGGGNDGSANAPTATETDRASPPSSVWNTFVPQIGQKRKRNRALIARAHVLGRHARDPVRRRECGKRREHAAGAALALRAMADADAKGVALDLDAQLPAAAGSRAHVATSARSSGASRRPTSARPTRTGDGTRPPSRRS